MSGIYDFTAQSLAGEQVPLENEPSAALALTFKLAQTKQFKQLQAQTIRMMNPTSGMKTMSHHQPDLSRSCNRRMPTDNPGRNNPSPTIVLSGAKPELEKTMASITFVTIDTRIANKNQYQYADRCARPLKLT
jgi:hypothetical protein